MIMRPPFTQHKAPGQVMLISILILSLLTLGSIIIGITAIVRESQSTSAMENKALASAAATACMEQAMDRLGRDIDYAGDEVLDVVDMNCVIRPIVYDGAAWTIETYSWVNNQVARYRVVLTSRTPVFIESWQEVATF
mgnify:FL=1